MQSAPSPIPLTRDLVLIGGGHAHALLLRMWGMNPLPGVRVTLINPGPTAPYTGMLPGFVAGHYSRDALDIDLVRLARFAGARLILGAATQIDRDAGCIGVRGRPAVAYDVASIDIGIHSELPDLPGFEAHGTPAKPLDRFARAWAAHLDRLRADPALSGKGLAVIGAGIGGVELAMAMAQGAQGTGAPPGPVHVIDRDRALPGLGAGAARVLRHRLHAMGIVLIEDTGVDSLHADRVILADGRTIPAAFCVTAAGARPWDWLADTGLALERGFIRIDPCLRSLTDPAIFAVGDCAHMDHAPRPKAGVYAVRQAPVLFQNLRAALGAGIARRYSPQRDYLKLISLGRKSAVADKFGLRLEGPLLWRWKDRIDRAFMARLADLPAMKVEPLPRDLATGVRDALGGGQAMCGGCGSKLGRGGLRRALARLPTTPRVDVETVPGDDAAVLLFGDERQVISTDHLRAFVQDPFVMARIAANHALGDVFAMGARPQAALPTVILPRATPELHDRMMTEILRASGAVFAEAGAAIVGGHTLIGDTLSLGFTVTGLARRPVTLAGARAGDALILTKPLGSGVIMAAEMALAARGAWVAGALAAMQQSQRQAATILAQAHAMTDVTGFGLAGHLMGILEAAELSARLTLDAIPLLDGAADLAAAGRRSTLFAENATIRGAMTLPPDPRADLLFDPQTAGGLLAALPADLADTTLKALQRAGYRAACIGHLSDGPPHITVA